MRDGWRGGSEDDMTIEQEVSRYAREYAESSELLTPLLGSSRRCAPRDDKTVGVEGGWCYRNELDQTAVQRLAALVAT